MKKLFGIIVLVSTALVLISCGGGGGGGGGSTTPVSNGGGGSVAASVATFNTSANADYVMVFNSNYTAVCTTTVFGFVGDVDNFTWSYQTGNFDNGRLNFDGVCNPIITIANGAFNYRADDGSGDIIHFQKTSGTSNPPVTFSGSGSGGFVIDFKNNNTCTFTGTGFFAGDSDSYVYSITSGDFNNGTFVNEDGDTITITNGSFSFTTEIEDSIGVPHNVTLTFVKQ